MYFGIIKCFARLFTKNHKEPDLSRKRCSHVSDWRGRGWNTSVLWLERGCFDFNFQLALIVEVTNSKFPTAHKVDMLYSIIFYTDTQVFRLSNFVSLRGSVEYKQSYLMK